MRPPQPTHLQRRPPSVADRPLLTFSSLRHRCRLGRMRALLVSIVGAIAVGAVLAGGASAWTTNLVQLDNGNCGRNLQIGSDKKASSSATPSFWLQGDGGLSS